MVEPRIGQLVKALVGVDRADVAAAEQGGERLRMKLHAAAQSGSDQFAAGKLSVTQAVDQLFMIQSVRER